MFEFAKKGFYVGLGMASFTKEKAEAFAKDFAEQTKLSEEEGRKFAEYLRQESTQAREDLSETVEEMVEKTMEKLPFKRRVRTLEDRVAKLEEALASCCPEKAEELGIGPAADKDETCEPEPEEEDESTEGDENGSEKDESKES